MSLPVAYSLMWVHTEVTGNIYLGLGLWPLLLALIALLSALLTGVGLWSFWRHSAASRARTVWTVVLCTLLLPIVWTAAVLTALFA